MKEFKYVIQDEQGIHARPAGILVKAAGHLKVIYTFIKIKTGGFKKDFRGHGTLYKKRRRDQGHCRGRGRGGSRGENRNAV